MKRILSAVTSLTMGISILTSAFAVPFSTYAVSEASSFAEQSVITANDKVAAKNASSADALQWSIDNVKQASYKAGDVIYVDVFVTMHGVQILTRKVSVDYRHLLIMIKAHLNLLKSVNHAMVQLKAV